MTDSFYSDRTGGPRSRDLDYVTASAWRAILAAVDSKINANWLAKEFPELCPDGNGVAGTNTNNLYSTLEALVPGVEWRPSDEEPPDVSTALDLVDFIAQRIAKPVDGAWHSFFKHHELGFDVAAGQAQFRDEVNTIFRRTCIAFELGPDMRTVRLGPPEARQVLADLRPNSGDATLDALILDARRRYLLRDLGEERIGLEKLWDAFERLKTIEPGPDKKAQVTTLLDRVASGHMRQAFEDEATALTRLGNEMQIRHFETSKTPLADSEVDYLFARMATLLVHILRLTGRLAR